MVTYLYSEEGKKPTGNGKQSAGEIVREDLQQDSGAKSKYNGGDAL